MSVIRFYPHYEKRGEEKNFYATIIKWLLIFVLGISILFAIGLFIAKSRMAPQLSQLMLIGVILFVLGSAFDVLQSILRMKRMLGWYVGFSIWRNLMAFLLGIFFAIVLHLGIYGLVLGACLSILVALPFLSRFSIGRVPRIGDGSPEIAKEMIDYSFPLVIANFAALGLSLADRFVLQIYKGASVVGIYSANYSVSEYSITSVITIFTLSFVPLAISTWEQHGDAPTREFITKSARYFLLFSIPLVIFFSFFKIEIISILAAKDYIQGAKIIPFVLAGGFFLGLQQIYGVIMSIYKKSKLVMTIMLLVALLNVILNFLFVPQYGYIAAAYATAFSYLILLIMTVVYSKKYLTWSFPYKSVAKTLIASVVAASALTFLADYLPDYSPLAVIAILLPIFVIIYAIVLLIIKEFLPEEIGLVKTVLLEISRRPKKDA